MKVVVLSGAGLSAEAGLGTFRDVGGLWTQSGLAEVATPEGFAADPAKVFGFYDARRRNAAEAEPHPGHQALAALERADGVELTHVTQNVDDLMERAGAARVIHMHGELMSAWCRACDGRFDWRGDLGAGSECPGCGARALRPDIVWFGEVPYAMERIEAALCEAELFVAIGTSGEVYPAAGFVEVAREMGIATLELNLEPGAGSHLFAEHRYGPASEVVPAWVKSLM